jgi:hypothetical protein
MWLAVSLLLSGCATYDEQPQRAVYGEIRLPPETKNIGLSRVQPCPRFTLELPADAQHLTKEPTNIAAQGDPELLLPPVYIIGNLAGWSTGLSEQELLEAVRAIDATAQAFALDERLAVTINSLIQRRLPGQIEIVAENAPTEFADPSDHHARNVMGKVYRAKDLPQSHPLADSHIDTVISVRVRFQGLRTLSATNQDAGWSTIFDHFNPPMALVLQVYVSAVRVADWKELGGLTIYYESDPQRFKDWTAHHAQSLRRAFETGLSEINAGIESQLIIIPSQ